MDKREGTGSVCPPEGIMKLHKEILYPTVRVTTKKAGGSGTVVYSQRDSNNNVVTMVMTNHHVVESCIKVERKWDSRIGQDRKKETKETVHVDFFSYNDYSRNIGSQSVEADIVAYTPVDGGEDMALLQLRDTETLRTHVANIFPIDSYKEINLFNPIRVVGAALGHPPLPTMGEICFMDDEIDNHKYWCCSAANIYGNSGGGLFRFSESRNRYEYVAIPSRISVVLAGFSADPITHMGYSIPIDRITKFWERECYQFIYDPEYTPEQCDKMREQMRKEADRKLEAKYGVVDGSDED